MKIIFTLIMLCLYACNVRPELSPRDHAVISRTVEAWRLAHKSWNTPEDCLDNVSIVQVHTGNFERLCHKPEFFSEGCVEERGFGHAPGKIMFISPAVRSDMKDNAVVHLALHELCRCTAKKGARSPEDDLHQRKDVWVETSGDGSLEKFIIGGIRNEVMQ